MTVLRSIFVLAATAAALVGCSRNPVTLVRVSSDTPAGQCAAGGVSIQSGSDANGSGWLDDDEIDPTLTKVLCSGTPGPAGDAGVNGMNGMNGANGMNGTNGTNGTNGMNGANGDAGVNGLASLTKVTAEPAGTHCRYGGARVDTGLDLNRDATLDTAEITMTQYICDSTSLNAWYFGDLHLEAPADLVLLDGIQVVIGSVYVDETVGATFAFPDLQIVTGEFGFSGSNSGGGGSQVRAPHGPANNGSLLATVSLPALTRAGAFYFDSLNELTSFSAPKLAMLDDGFGIQNCPLVTSVALPSLTRARSGFYVGGNALLTSISAPLLPRTGSLDISYNEVLPTLTLPELLEVDQLRINGNIVLTQLSLPKLAGISSMIEVNDNTLLTACPLYHLTLTPFPNNVDINNNADTCTEADQCRTVTIAGMGGTKRLCLTYLNFNAAQALCHRLDQFPDGGFPDYGPADGGAHGTNLIWFESAGEYAAMATAMRAQQLPGDFWAGYTDLAVENTWATLSGYVGYDPTTDPDAGFWEPGEPNGLRNENAMQIYANGRGNDLPATSTQKPFCRTP